MQFSLFIFLSLVSLCSLTPYRDAFAAAFTIREIGELPVPEKDEEMTTRNILPARRGVSGAVHQGVLYLVGGHVAVGDPHNFSHDTLLRSLDAWNLSTKENKHLPSFEERGHFASLVVVDGFLYKFGGFYSKDREEQSQRSYDIVERINLASPTRWESLSRMPHPRNQFGAVTLGRKTYLIAGWDAQHIKNFDLQKNLEDLFIQPVDVFNHDTLKFETTTLKLPEGEGRRGFSAIAWNGKIVVSGGFGTSETSFLKSVWLFDPNVKEGDEAWRKIADLPSRMIFPAVITFKGKLYLVSGYNFDQHRLISHCYILSDDLKTWNETDIPADPHSGRTAVQAGPDHWLLINGSLNHKPTANISEIK